MAVNTHSRLEVSSIMMQRQEVALKHHGRKYVWPKTYFR